jgi:anthranilate synthase component 2
MSCKVIVADAYDSFVYVLVGYLLTLGCEVSVFRKDDVRLAQAVQRSEGDILLLGPGPGHPAHSGYQNLLHLNADRMPVLGVCLGHQAIGLHYGCQIDYASHLMHGKTSFISHDRQGCFKSFVNNTITGMRYHSIVISDQHLSKALEISARSDDDGYIMGVRCASSKMEGIQFHPESIGTEMGIDILRNFIDTYSHH